MLARCHCSVKADLLVGSEEEEDDRAEHKVRGAEG